MPPCVPPRLPPSNVDLGSLIGLVGESNAALAGYNGLLQSLVNPNLLLSPLTLVVTHIS